MVHTVHLDTGLRGAPSGHDGVCRCVLFHHIIYDQPVLGAFTLHTIPGTHPSGNLHPVLQPIVVR